uniref:Dynamin-like GTPase OPA1, mitochondrial n=1 Tax=Macrostomum lignano TaxID=282301 RepID=A0A1I8JN96_9PLAT
MNPYGGPVQPADAVRGSSPSPSPLASALAYCASRASSIFEMPTSYHHHMQTGGRSRSSRHRDAAGGLAGSSAARLAARAPPRPPAEAALAVGRRHRQRGIAAANKYEEIKAGMPDLGRLRGFCRLRSPSTRWRTRCNALVGLVEELRCQFKVTCPASIGRLQQSRRRRESSAAALDADAPTELAQQLEELEIRYQRRGRLARGRSSRASPPAGRAAAGRPRPRLPVGSEVPDRHVQRSAGRPVERDAKFFCRRDHLPRVVVIGDQSSGKTSVLEAVARARLFPRGAGRMMTRAPVQFDLTKESELAALRDAIERRMRAAVRSSGRMPLSPLRRSRCRCRAPACPAWCWWTCPGIISTETAGMAAQTRDTCATPTPSSLCVADACVDPERSNAFDLVAKHDPAGRRTIFVLTKMDLAREGQGEAAVSPDRVAKLLAGRLLPLKALGYFAVGRAVRTNLLKQFERHEAEYFASSRLFKDGRLSPNQVTAANMARAVSRRFWALVRESVEAQADSLKALRFNLETEWKHSFPGRRQCSRAELFEKGARWEAAFRDSLSGPLLSQALDLLLEAESANSAPEARPELLQTRLDIGLRRWVESDLPGQCVTRGPLRAGGDPVLEPLCSAVRAEAVQAHRWDPKAEAALRVLQSAALLDQGAEPGRADWDSAVALLRQALRHRLAETEAELAQVCGPSGWQRWAKWLKAPTPEQDRLSRLVQALRTAAGSAGIPSASLSAADLAAARRSFASHRSPGEAAGAAVTDEELREAWPLVRRQMALRAGLANCDQCARMFYHYQQRLSTAAACAAVPYFHRVGRMLNATCSALRQQAVNIEARRLERAVGDALTGLAAEPGRLRDVQLAEDIHSLRLAEEKLDRFIEALNSADDAIEGDRSGGTFADTGGGNEGFAFSKSRRRKTSL